MRSATVFEVTPCSAKARLRSNFEVIILLYFVIMGAKIRIYFDICKKMGDFLGERGRKRGNGDGGQTKRGEKFVTGEWGRMRNFAVR
jgi:hypothetical protein